MVAPVGRITFAIVMVIGIAKGLRGAVFLGGLTIATLSSSSPTIMVVWLVVWLVV